MVVAVLPIDSFAYEVVYALHLLAVVVGFGSTFVQPFLASRARALDPPARAEVSRLSFDAGKVLGTPFIYAAGVFGVILVLLSEDVYEFSQTWISIAFLLFIVAAVVAGVVHGPNLRRLVALEQEAAAHAGPGEPPQLAEIQTRGKRAGMFGGILHLLFLLLLLDMVFKPGWP